MTNAKAAFFNVLSFDTVISHITVYHGFSYHGQSSQRLMMEEASEEHHSLPSQANVALEPGIATKYYHCDILALEYYPFYSVMLE